MSTWPLHYTAELLRFYGDPRDRWGCESSAWVDQNVVSIPIPFRMFYDYERRVPLTKGLRVHRLCADAFSEALAKLHTRFGDDGILAQNLDVTSGAYQFGHADPLRPGELSIYAFGCAIEFDPDYNRENDIGRMLPDVIEVMESCGFVWGADPRLREKIRRPGCFQLTSVLG